MKNIMKRAWEIYRTLIGTHIEKISAAMKKAWAEFKAASSKKAFDGEAMVDGFQFVLWEKYGKRRIYVNNYTGSNKSNKGGYIDLDTMNISAVGCVKDACKRFIKEYAI